MTATTPPDTCPSHRKSERPGEVPGRGVRLEHGVWRVSSMPAAREVLRASETTQAGFNVETMPMGHIKPPILFTDGEDHREQRSQTARFFAPKTVDARYRDLMERLADDVVAQFRRAGEEYATIDLPKATLRYSVEVAATVLGLTNSDVDAMSRRLDAFFATEFLPADPGAATSMRDRMRGLVQMVHGQRRTFTFYLLDVVPAVRARRRQRQDDVISYCLDRGFSSLDILTECLTYAAAGMVTTREFISMATWHLLDNPELRRRYLEADQAERYAILHEILRLEPVVGHLFRRLQHDVEVPDGGRMVTIPAGALVDVAVRDSNADPDVVGERPLQLCPMRPLPPRVGPEVLSFGDGPHKCPGNAIAIQEADMLLTRLLRLPLRLVSRPTIGWDELIQGYEVRNVRLAVDSH